MGKLTGKSKNPKEIPAEAKPLNWIKAAAPMIRADVVLMISAAIKINVARERDPKCHLRVSSSPRAHWEQFWKIS